jgi:aryl-alcohol dehydrogenase-like predicted oxidoreductase
MRIMTFRRLGPVGPEVAPLALGANVFGWTIDEATSFRLLDAFVDAGFNLIDTADVYSRWAPGNHGGESETILGRWVQKSGKRSKVVLATKVGLDMGEGRVGLRPARIRQAVDDSLQRLQTDVIDLYQAHRDDPDTPLADTLGAFDELIQAGKVRAIGASNYTGARLAEALEVSRSHGLASYQTLQPHYNLVHRGEFEHDLRPVCDAHGLAVIPYYSLASGFLTGKYRSEADLGKSRGRGPAVTKYLNPQGLAVVEAVASVATRLGATPAQVALAWLQSQPTVAAPIASATSVEQLHDILRSARVELDAASLAQLDAASAG